MHTGNRYGYPTVRLQPDEALKLKSINNQANEKPYQAYPFIEPNDDDDDDLPDDVLQNTDMKPPEYNYPFTGLIVFLW